MKRYIGLGALFGAVMLASSCAQPARDSLDAERGADALAAGQYEAAELALNSALERDPTDAYALLNLGVVYQNTGRQERARQTYAEIIRLDRAKRAGGAVARRGGGLKPAELARENMLELGGEPSRSSATPMAPSWYGNNAPLDGEGPAGSADFAALYDNLRRLHDGMQGLAESMRLMSGRLSRAAQDAAARMAAAEVRAGRAQIRNVAADLQWRGDDGDAPAAAEPAPQPERWTDSAAFGGDSGTPRERRAETDYDETVGLLENAEADGMAGMETGIGVHIASFRSRDGAERGWKDIKKSNADLLGALNSEIRRVDFGPGMGVFYRLQAGPLRDEQAAERLCDRLKDRGHYCATAYF